MTATQPQTAPGWFSRVVARMADAVARRAPAELPPPSVNDRWNEATLNDRRLLPADVDRLLRDGLTGDLTDQMALFTKMQDTWPRLAHNVRTLREALEAAPFEAHPWSDDDGTEVTESAQEKCALVKRAMWGMCPDLARMELSFEGGLRALAGGTVQGHSVLEILWESRSDAGGGVAILPRALRKTGSSHFSYQMSAWGKKAEGDRLMFRPGGLLNTTLADFPENQFITGIFPGHDGHPSAAAPLRSLAKYWIAATYGPEWLLKYAQIFGQPFRWATYIRGDTAVKDEVLNMLKNLSNGYSAFPEGTQLNLHEASKSAGDLPQKLLIDLADQAADILILGQTLSAAAGGEGSGSYALGKVHQTVRRERLAACGKAVAAVLTHQFARAVCVLNYGDASECPEIRCDLPEPEDEKAKAERDQVLVGLGVKLPTQWLYERHGVPQPQEGEECIGGVQAPDVPDGEDPPVDPATDPALTTLNGAQVTALADLVNKVAAGLLPYESALNTALAAFPTIPPATILKIFRPVRKFKLPTAVKPEAGAAPASDKPEPEEEPDEPAKASFAGIVPDPFVSDLTDTLSHVLEHAAAQGFEATIGEPIPTKAE